MFHHAESVDGDSSSGEPMSGRQLWWSLLLIGTALPHFLTRSQQWHSWTIWVNFFVASQHDMTMTRPSDDVITTPTPPSHFIQTERNFNTVIQIPSFHLCHRVGVFHVKELFRVYFLFGAFVKFKILWILFWLGALKTYFYFHLDFICTLLLSKEICKRVQIYMRSQWFLKFQKLTIKTNLWYKSICYLFWEVVKMGNQTVSCLSMKILLDQLWFYRVALCKS